MMYKVAAGWVTRASAHGNPSEPGYTGPGHTVLQTQQGSLSKVTGDSSGHSDETEDYTIQAGTTGWIGENRRGERRKGAS